MDEDELVTRYQASSDQRYFYELYIMVSKQWLRYKHRDIKRSLSSEHEVLAIYDNALLKALDKFDGTKGKFVPFLFRVIRNMLLDLRRKEIRRRRESDFNFKSPDGNPEEFNFETVEDHTVKVEDEGISIQKERDQRQLISHLVSSTKDEITLKLVEVFDQYDSYNSLGKAVGIDNKTAKRKIERLSRFYDGNRFGELRDYLAV